LHADQADQRLAAAAAHLSSDLVGTDAGVGLVERLDDHVDTGAEDLTPPAVLAEAVERGQRVRRNVGAEPSNRVAVVVVMRRLDQNQMKGLTLHITAHRGISPKGTSAYGSIERLLPLNGIPSVTMR
jgi:hypothetical protein